MSDVDPTPETPVTIGDRMAWWRGDMAARLTTLEAQVAALAGSPAADMAGLLASTNAIRGTPSTTLYDIAQWQQAIIAMLGTTNNELDNIRQAVVAYETRIDRIQAALGAVPYNDLELGSVRGLLNALVLNQGRFGITPDGDTATMQSGASHTEDGRRYVLWPEGIAGVTTTGTPLGRTIIPAIDWQGYEFYIQSDAPNANIGAVEIPTNSWITLNEGTVEIWVASQYLIRGFIRIPLVTTDIRVIGGYRRAWFAALDPAANDASFSGNWIGWRATASNQGVPIAGLQFLYLRPNGVSGFLSAANPIPFDTLLIAVISETAITWDLARLISP